MAYDASRGVTMLFGGYTSDTIHQNAQTWEWNGSSWTDRTSTGGPTARYSHAMAYDGAHAVSLLFGGYTSDPPPVGVYYQDTWQYGLTMLRGDMNCDGVVDPNDIVPFIQAMTDPTGYQLQYPTCDILHADMLGDGQADGVDVQGFIAALAPQA